VTSISVRRDNKFGRLHFDTVEVHLLISCFICSTYSLYKYAATVPARFLTALCSHVASYTLNPTVETCLVLVIIVFVISLSPLDRVAAMKVAIREHVFLAFL
jgi:hypothetical protein